MEPNWEINNENMTRVLHGQHEVEEAIRDFSDCGVTAGS